MEVEPVLVLMERGGRGSDVVGVVGVAGVAGVAAVVVARSSEQEVLSTGTKLAGSTIRFSPHG